MSKYDTDIAHAHTELLALRNSGSIAFIADTYQQTASRAIETLLKQHAVLKMMQERVNVLSEQNARLQKEIAHLNAAAQPKDGPVPPQEPPVESDGGETDLHIVVIAGQGELPPALRSMLAAMGAKVTG